MGYAVVRPPGSAGRGPIPACLCLPGRGGTAGDTLRDLSAADALAQAVVERGVPPFALVAVDGGESYWHPRAGGEDRLAMPFDEVLPLVGGALGLSGRRALVGWSMGGYGAPLAAETRPDAFRAVAAVSPAIWTSRFDADGKRTLAGVVGDGFDTVSLPDGTTTAVEGNVLAIEVTRNVDAVTLSGPAGRRRVP